MSKYLVLVIEDDKTIRKFINASLITQDYLVKEATTGKEGISLCMSYSPDVILLDLGLEDMDGIEVIKNIRNLSEVPIIVVSAREQDREKVEAFETGADDYITKPFSVAELLARIKVAIRHLEKNKPKSEVNSNFNYKGLNIDFNKRKVNIRGEEIHLTPNEYDILSLMVNYHGKVLTHKFIAKEIWGSTLGSEIKSLRVFMATLRRKIEKEPANPEYILTEIGIGYKLNDEE